MPQQELINKVREQLNGRGSSTCFACGPDNPRGLHLQFEKSEGEMIAEWTPDATLEGFHGVVHGGIVSTVLDESMAKAVSAAGVPAFTAELRVRLRRNVAPGESLRVKGWVLDRKNRIIRTEAALSALDGTELAHAWAAFLTLA